MSLYALKIVGNDFKSALVSHVAPGGLWSAALDASYQLTYTVSGSTTAVQMPNDPGLERR